MPLWLLYLLTVAAVFRLTRLGIRDDFPPVLWLRDRLAGGWRPLTPKEVQQQVDWEAVHANDPHAPLPAYLAYGHTLEIDGVENRFIRRASWSPYWLAELVSCPWCLSGWISGAMTAALDLNQSVPDPALFGVAVWGGAALLASRPWA